MLACIVPAIILPYYCTIGGWVLKYFTLFITGSGKNAVADGYFTGFITGQWAPIIFGVVYLLITAAVVIGGVNKGIERFSKVLMPILVVLIFAIGIFSLTLHYKEASGAVRSGLEGLKIYVVPDFKGLTMQKLATVFVDALGQLFYSISVAMGIMVAYGSYVKKESKLMGSINQIEIFDTLVAFLAGLMIIPAVFAFSGGDPDALQAGPALMFITLPKVFANMGFGTAAGILFFLLVLFAAVTSSIALTESAVSTFEDELGWNRKKATLVLAVIMVSLGSLSCLGYGPLAGVKIIGMQFLDFFDFLTISVMMPIAAMLTSLFVSRIVGMKRMEEEIMHGESTFRRKKIFIVMIKYLCPVFALIILISSVANAFGWIAM